MSLTLVVQLFTPLMQVTAAEVPTGITKMAAKAKGNNEAELDLSLDNPNEDKRTEKVNLSPNAHVKQIPATNLVSTTGKDVGTYEIKEHEIDFVINGKVSDQVKVPVVFTDDNTTEQVIFTSGQLQAKVNLPNKQDAVANSEQEASQTSDTSSVTGKSKVAASSVTSSASSDSTIASEKAAISAKKSQSVKNAAKVKDEAGEDISQYLPASSNGTIITGATLKFTDSDGNEVPEDKITTDTQVSLSYTWAIPNELKDNYDIKAGDYFDFKLPANVQYKPQSNGNLGEYGSYSIKADGTVRFTFNSNVENASDIQGTFDYNRAQIKVDEPGDKTITIDTTSGPIEHNIVVHPKNGNDIAKSVRTSPAQNAQSIKWNVDVNTSLNELKDAKITDDLPQELKMSTSEHPVVKVLNVGVDGSKTEEATLTENTDYTVDDAGNITLIGTYAKTSKAFRVIYTTDIESSAIPDDGGNVSVTNKATLTNDGKDYDASATASLSYGKLLEKSMSNTNQGQKLNWTIKYNGGDKKLAKGTKLVDKLSGDQIYDGEPKLVYLDGPNKGQTVAASDYTVAYSDDKKEMTITFTNGLDQAVEIQYGSKITGPINGSTVVNNSVSSDGKTVETGQNQIGEQGIIKGRNKVDYNQKTVEWNVTINSGRQEMKNWSAEDTLPEGLTLNKDSVKITDTDSGKVLEPGKEYQITDTSAGFKIEFLGALKDSATHRYDLTYTTSFDTSKLGENQKSWVNKINATWTDVNGETHHNEGQASFTPKVEYINDASKSGSYNANNKHITWTVVANYNQRDLKNAQIVDTLQGDPKYVDGSAKLYEATINPDGSYTLGDEVTSGGINYDESSRTITAKLADGNKAYVLKYETSLEGQVIDKTSYNNTATYTNNGQKQDVTAQVSVPNSDEVAYKTGQQDPDDSAYALWDIYVNREQSTLSDVTVTDYPTGDQYLEKENVHVYGTKVSSDGKSVTIDKSNELKQGTDYTVDIDTDQMTGVQTMTVKFKNKISTSYVVEYRALITTPEASATLGNTAEVTAKGLKDGGKTVEKDITVENSGGTSSGTNYNYRLTKVDQDDPDKVLPGVKFELWTSKLVNGQTVKGQAFRTSTTDKDGKIQWNNLKSGTYFLVEKSALSGYQTAADKKIVINDSQADSDHLVSQQVTNEKVKTNVSGSKTWKDNNDQDGKRPSEIKVNLLANGKKVKEQAVKAGTDGSWKYNFTNLDKFDVNGDPIAYTVNEEKVPGYQTSYDGTDITNTHEVAKTNVSGQKIWKDHDDQDGKRPSEITVNLLANGQKVDSQTVSAKNGWKYEFKDLDKYKAGQEIKYTVKEDNVAGYKTSYDGNNIVNTHQPEKISLDGNKSWNDNDDQDGNRPDSITLHLLKNGQEVKGAVQTVTAKNDWKYSFKDLDKYEKGQEVKYTVTEDNVPDYTANVSDATKVVNTYSPGKTSATVTKAWNDKDDQDGLRTNVKVQLYANGEPYGQPVELSQDQDWTHTWTDLNQRKGKKDIKYTVREVNTPDGYTSTVKDDNQGNMIITNTHEVAKTNVAGQKTWKDNNDQDGKRPSKIIVNLLADGKKVASKTVTAKDDWKYSFTGLDKYQAGKEVKYTITEDQVNGYTTQIKGNDLINTLNHKGVIPGDHSSNNKINHPTNSQGNNQQNVKKNPAKKHGILAFLPKTGEMNPGSFAILGLLVVVIVLGAGAYVFGRKTRNKD